MKNLSLTFLLALILVACGSSKPDANEQTSMPKKVVEPAIDLSVKYAETITSDELKEMLYTYASDEFEGRETGEAGQKKAVEYLKKHYVDMGIASPYGTDDYFQEVPLEKMMMPTIKLSANDKEFTGLDNIMSLRGAASEVITTDQIVYVGYGIDDENYSDYKDVDVNGMVVLAKYGEPKDASGNFITSGKTDLTKWTNGRQARTSKRNVAIEKGAKALIYVEDPTNFAQINAYYKRLEERGGSGNISLKSDDANFINVAISEEVAKAIYPEIMTAEKPMLIESHLTLDYHSAAEEVNSENVVAFIKGSEKPDEILVISAHLDHEGVKDGVVYNGADDDGSGTIAIIEIAEAFQQAVKEGNGPKRSILFLHVTGEEKGLLGSRYYADMDPIFPLENTVANLNIDMIGRIDPKREGDRNYVYLIGSDKLSQDLHDLSEEVNSKYTNVTLDYTYNDDNDPNRFYYRSDHYNFAKNNIPIIFYFNGTHADYHQPSDTPDKIEYDLLENRTRLIFHTAWEVANIDKRIMADKLMTN